ncbi:MAG: hypothetical protein JWO45_1264 [Spartobacteria bacterium]|nr:hypothetical protein [Spartobacteria bacterium]
MIKIDRLRGLAIAVLVLALMALIAKFSVGVIRTFRLLYLAGQRTE